MSSTFVGFKAVGFVSNHLPLQLRYIQRRREHLVVTCVGNTIHTYSTASLRLLSVGKPLDKEITGMASDAYHVYTATGSEIRAWRRGTEIVLIYSPEKMGKSGSKVTLMLPFGPHLIAVYKDGTVRVWDIKAETIYLEFSLPPSEFEITSMVHPATYINKVVFGSSQGMYQLWNLRTGILIHTFAGWGSAINVIEQAPAVDVLAFGLQDGCIILHNIKLDETIMTLRQETALGTVNTSPVTALSFRTDGKVPTLASGSPEGHIAIWNLEERKLVSEIRHAHDGPVAGLEFQQGEPLLLSNSLDNTLKQWIFDSGLGARLLRIREGHAEPPSKALFYGENGEEIITAGADSTVRVFATFKADGTFKNLGKAAYNRNALKKVMRKDRYKDPSEAEDGGKYKDDYERKIMPPITQLAGVLTRTKEWADIVACHRDTSIVTTWSYHKSCMGDKKLRHERFMKDHRLKKAVATCIDVSACGNFAVIGYDSGHVDKFNIQSGLHRGAFVHEVPSPEGDQGGKRIKKREFDDVAHEGPIRGVIVDGLNQLVVTGGAGSATEPPSLKFWKFKTRQFGLQVPMPSPVAAMCVHRESGLLAVALDDFTVRVIDLDDRNPGTLGRSARNLGSRHRARLTDMCFSPDSRWLVTAALDSTVLVWDVVTGLAMDWFRTPYPCTSMSFSPSSEFLATCHAGCLGVYLWANKTLYMPVTGAKSLSADYKPKLMPLPGASIDEDVKAECVDVEKEDDGEAVELEAFKSPQQISQDLVTLALLPESKWANLLNLDIIKARNKPKEPPRAPKAAPFFLPTVAGLAPDFDVTADKQEEEDEEKRRREAAESSRSRVLRMTETRHSSKFVALVDKAETKEDYREVVEALKEYGPAQIDIELRSLSPINGGSVELMKAFLESMRLAFDECRNFEAAQSYLSLFLKLHWDEMPDHQELMDVVPSLADSQKASWEKLHRKLTDSLCLANFLDNVVL